MSVNRASMIVGLASELITAQCGCDFPYTSFWLCLYIKWLNNTYWGLCKWYKLLLSRSMWQEYSVQICLYRMAYPCFWMVAIKCHIYYWSCTTNNCWRSIDAHFQHGSGIVWPSLFTIKAANASFMALYNLSPPRLPKIHDQQSLMLHWCSFSGCGRVHVSVCFDHEGGQYIKNNQWFTNVNILQLTVAYLNATRDSETWNAETEIGTDGSSQSRQTVWVDGYRSGFGPPRGSKSGFWMGLECNRPVFAVQTRTAGRLPGPVADTSWVQKW